VPESLKQQIDRLQELYESELDPGGRAFVPLADAHRRLGDLGKALALIQEGLGTHPDFASAHLVLGWVHCSRQEPDDAMRSFERVLELDAENTVARVAIAELIDDQRAQAYRDQVAARESGGRPVVPIASLAPGAPMETVAAPELVLDDGRPVVPIASLAPGAPAETSAPADAAPESVRDGDDRPVVPIPSLAPEGDEEASDHDGQIDGEIYTQTLAELYVAQGATGRAIEVYGKLIADDPDNEALHRRLTELESLESGADGAPAVLDVRAGLGALVAGLDERQTVSIESIAPDGIG
jgi:tetratricopeptide (TPR) repeat protein